MSGHCIIQICCTGISLLYPFFCLCSRPPVLLQGPTSVGKTSLIRYLATCTGHTCMRINNHEHTDLQEYLGSYVTGDNGQLVFQEGAYTADY